MHNFIFRFHKHILIFCVALTIAAACLTLRLKLNSDLFSLLPADDPGVKTFLDISEKIGFQEQLVVIVDMPDTDQAGESEAIIDHLAETFSKSELLNNIEYKTGDLEIAGILNGFIQNLPYILTPDDFEQLADHLSDNAIDNQIRKNKQILMTPFGIAGKELISIDPLGLRSFAEKKLSGFSEKNLAGRRAGYFRTEDNKTWFLFLKPKKRPQDVAFSKKLMAEIKQLSRQALKNRPDISVAYTGGYAIAVNDEAATKKDINATLLTSFIGVMLLFALTFRAPKTLLYVGIPLAASLIWTLGFASLVFKQLNILSCVFSCVLMGIGIDFAIHIINRYFDAGLADHPAIERLHHTFQEAGSGIVVGGITTAAAFFSLGISDFGGFRELGILTGFAILICLAAMFFLLPAMLVYGSPANKDKKQIAVAGLGLQPALAVVQKYPKTIIAICLMLACGLAPQGNNIQFDDNFRNFRPENDTIIRLQDKVTAWLGGSAANILLVTRGTSEKEALKNNALIYDALKELESEQKIAGITSINTVLISPDDQTKNIDYMRKNPGMFDINRIKQRFDHTMAENGFLFTADHYEPYFNSLAHAFSQQTLFSRAALSGTKLSALIKPFVFQKDGGFHYITYVKPSADLWSRKDTQVFRQMMINKLDEKGIEKTSYSLTGANLLTGDIKHLVISNLKSSLWLACISIAGVLLIYYRNIKLFFLACLPLLFGLAVLAGIMAIFKIDFNFINLMVVPMIVGLGIDDGVHFTNTFQKTDGADLSKEMMRTGRAVILTSLTTLAGFGSLALSHYPGIKSMGYVAAAGIIACLIASIVILPAVFTLMKQK